MERKIFEKPLDFFVYTEYNKRVHRKEARW